MPISVSECCPDRLADLRAFLARMYRSDYVLATNEAFLRWQFGSTAAAANGGACHIKLGLVDGVIAGCLGYIPVDVSMSGRQVRGAWTANWMVDAARRQLGLGPLLMRALIRQHDVTLVVGASAAAREILPKMGFTSFGDLRRHVCVLDPAATGMLTHRDPACWAAAAQDAHRDHGQTRHGVRRVERFSGGVEPVWDALWGAADAGTRRSAAFLNWRYAAHPEFRYRLFEATFEGGVTGFAVYRVEPVRDLPVRVGRVLELVAGPGADDALVSSLIDDARAHDVALLDMFAASSRLAPALRRQGWLPEAECPAPVPTLFQPVAHGRRGIPFLAHLGNTRDCTDVERWYVTKGDGDQDRPN